MRLPGVGRLVVLEAVAQLQVSALVLGEVLSHVGNGCGGDLRGAFLQATVRNALPRLELHQSGRL